ncbi:survival motor neuron protein 1-like isoform X6 [Falco biarmicus]|uniref:survival motor neuron protein 1 isoform X6 n=1 Tax=Falco cherrug TaxID=345164 RepID=UPI002478824D|nr:survival motor neuron protein 1 isoform X6 [Falco cherrug]XP_055647029.1 survival motor neuron protein 1 isoform X6 [Falco peregrinus]XP_056180846.1 survival motor neuron protein 1-like isoform X6 [Falco biarmicus]
MAGQVVYRRGTGQSDDSDVWDDTALIKAYDKAVASFRNALKNGECSEPSDKQEQRLRMKRKNNKKNRNRKKSNAVPWKQNENETPYSTDESEKSSQLPRIKNNCTKARFSPQNFHFLSPPSTPGLGRPGSKFKALPSLLSCWPPPLPVGPPLIPPPPPMTPDSSEDDEALGSMLIAWYMSGYHTGYYLGLKQSRMEAALERQTHAK